MAISEITKQAVKQIRGQYQAQVDYIDREIAEHQASIDSLTAERVRLVAGLAALVKDIPEPAVAPINL